PNVEPMRGGERVGVAIRRAEPDDDLVPGGDRNVAYLRIAGRRPSEVPHGMAVAQDLLDGARDELRLASEEIPLVRMARERQEARRDRLTCRLVPGHHEDRERVVEIAAGERATVQLGVRDQRENVVGRGFSPRLVVLAAERAQLLGPGAPEREVAVLGTLATERELADVVGLRVDE